MKVREFRATLPVDFELAELRTDVKYLIRLKSVVPHTVLKDIERMANEYGMKAIVIAADCDIFEIVSDDELTIQRAAKGKS